MAAFIGSETARGFGQGAINFLHPGYNEPINLLFRMPRVDHVPSVDGELQFGLYHQTALAACQIVANNAFDGFLAVDRAGTQPVNTSIPLDGILTASEYYFIVPSSPTRKPTSSLSTPPPYTDGFAHNIDRYPVVPSFRDWQFPHKRIPNFWPRHGRPLISPLPSQLLCAVTGYTWAVQRAHLVPSNERAWFARNGMSKYGVDAVVDIDDTANYIALRSDVHICLDSLAFVLVPKVPESLSATGANPGDNSVPSPTDGMQQQPQQQRQAEYAVHILSGADPMFSRLHHDIRVPLSRLANCSREFLYARFALNILMGVKAFVTAGQRRRVARFMVVEADRGPELVEEDIDGPALFALYGAGKSRSASPAKRKRGEGSDSHGGQQAVDEEGYFASEDEEDDDTVWERHVRDIEEEQRGRSRKRARRDSSSNRPIIMGHNELKMHDQNQSVEVWRNDSAGASLGASSS